LVTRPVASIIAIVYLVGWYWLITGAVGVYLGITDKTNRVWKVLFGIIGILAGLVVIENPLLSGIMVPATLIMIVGVMSVIMGAIGLFHALKGDWGAAITGLLNLIFGMILLGSPLIALITLPFLLGGLSIAEGLVAVFIAFKLR
jgi:uncharacterized membrane protein HdeD (DUF308 family)